MPVKGQTDDSLDADAVEIDRAAIERLAFFSDAVVAIAITLLALDLPIPQGESSSAFIASLAANSFDYLTFAIGFAVVGSHWVAHHQIFRYMVGVARGLITLDLCWLMVIVVTPFLTRVLREGHLEVARFGLFALAQALLLLIFAVMQTVAARAGLFAATAPAALTRHGWINGTLRALGFLISIPVYAVIGNWAVLVWIIVPVIGARVRRALPAHP